MNRRLVACLLFAAALPAWAAEETVLEVTDKVLVEKPLRFGVNVELPRYSHWNNFIAVNQWAKYPGFEPVLYRFQNCATDGSETTLVDNSGSGLHWWSSFQGNWWAGATALVYRPTPDGGMKLLRTAKVKSSDCGKGATNVLTFAESGPAVQAGDFYQLTIEHTQVPPMRQNSYREYGFMRHIKTKRLPPEDRSVEVAYDTKKVAPKGGKSSLRVTVPEGGEWSGVADWWLTNLEKNPGFTKLPEGVKELKVKLLARQEGVEGGKLKIAIGNWSEEFAVTGEWKEYEFTFAPQNPTGNTALTTWGVYGRGPGKFWIDNFAIWDPRLPFGRINPNVIAALKDAQPGVIRIWSALNQGAGGITFDDALATEFERSTHIQLDSAHRAPEAASLPDMLQLCAEIGADPWIIINPAYTREEIAHFMEYLGGPVSSPYGKRRAELGQAKPWTEVFSRIYIELGNEQWNPPFRPLAFGFEWADLYGRFAKLQFGELKKSPVYNKDKFALILSGFIHNAAKFNDKAIAAAGDSADMMDIATYLRGGWDTADILTEDDPTGKVSEQTILQQLNYFVRMVQPNYESFKKLIEEHKRGGAVYEGGPGYQLPGPSKKVDPRDEIVGKSLALAVTTLDCYLTGQALGLDPACFYNFKPGNYWASHADADLTRPQPAWQALMMRNLYCSGKMLEVKATGVPTVDLPEIEIGSRDNSGKFKKQTLKAMRDVPTVKAYAYRDGGKVSVILFSRRLKEATDLTVKLPFNPKSAGKLITLTAADPLASNRDKMDVPIREQKLTGLKREHKLTLPPHSICVLQAEAQ